MHRYNKQPIEIGACSASRWKRCMRAAIRCPLLPGADTGKSRRADWRWPGISRLRGRAPPARHPRRIFDARPLPGGLNTYGIAEYKLPLAESLREIDMLAQLGVKFNFTRYRRCERTGRARSMNDAVFLGIGLGAIHKLGLADEELPGMTNALDFIAGL